MDAFRTAYIYVRNAFAGGLCETVYTLKIKVPMSATSKSKNNYFIKAVLRMDCLLIFLY